ncbi:aftiphilin a isoform X1 [Tachysurus vachellii]|uniref:aftiphilin a isoform X1 n=1 Tax=Tachysurus vachellii TaxID=175792 RepID=UPI00296AA54B|nr:aftiphilin a isoform X1 [Tachysurus vachellii]
MEPDVIHMYSSSPPPLEDGADEDDDEFSDFTGVPNSVSFTEFETPTTFNQLQALNATSPPELISNGRVVGLNGPAVSNGGQGDAPACRTVSVDELKKVTERPHGAYTNFSDFPGNARTGSDAVDCNGRGSEVLTNGFANVGTEGTPPSPHIHREMGPSGGDCPDAVISDNEDFADFAAFSNADVPSDPDSIANWENSNHDVRLAQDDHPQREENHEAVDNDVDNCVTGFASFAEASDHLSNGDGFFYARKSNGQREQDTEPACQDSNTTESVSTEQRISQNGGEQDGLDVKERMDNRVSPVSMDERGSNSEPTEEKVSGNDTETETETETSFGRPLSTEALEEFGDFSTTGSVPSPPLQEETATPADHSQLAEDDDDEDFGDFGDFGDASSFGGAGFADFDNQGAAPYTAPSESIKPSQSQNNPETVCADKDEFGDFDAHGQPGKTAQDREEEVETAEFPVSDSFADFTAAPVDGDADDNGGWQAFGGSSKDAGVSWATFSQDQGSNFSEKSEDDWHESRPVTAPSTGIDEECRKNSFTVSLVSRLEKLFLASFLEISFPHVEEDVPPLTAYLEPCEGGEKQDNQPAPISRGVQGVWLQLQDIHSAFGLRYQWGGSHSNKALLCSLGIDTRNILFTGQKKQPVIVPMYAASLGMLEPTKEPVKPVSAAEMIASIAQSPSVSTEMSTCPTDAAQDSLPPVQFDWSSSGLTNPLDASGGSSLLNLDFFGPVDESPSSTTTSIPGVDPELYELTQAKLDVSGGSSRVVDAFARLMSTVEKTNTSTRRVQTQKEENLSEEARRVISILPDLSFMQAKVLMFPSTLTPLPLSSCSSISPSPIPD